MKFPNILIYFAVSLIPLTAAAAAAVVQYKLKCDVVQKYVNVCKHDDFLQSVRELPYLNGRDVIQQQLYIKDSSISSIVSDAFHTFDPPFFTELSLEFKRSELHLEPKSFNGLERLKTLNIISGIVEPTPNLFESLKSLTNLTLSFNPQSKYFENSLSSLQNLTSLKIFATNFSIITSNTFYNVAPTIKNLELHNNIINKIEISAFSTFKSLETLKIVDDQLMNFEPGALLGLISLKSLEIRRQPMTTIEKNTFINLKKLNSLSITNNMINKIEKGTFSGLYLEVLDLSYNAIATIETQSFYQLNISVLILSNNPIVQIHNNAFVQSNVMIIISRNTTLAVINPKAWGIRPTITDV